MLAALNEALLHYFCEDKNDRPIIHPIVRLLILSDTSLGGEFQRTRRSDRAVTHKIEVTIQWLQVATAHTAFTLFTFDKKCPIIHGVRKLIIYSTYVGMVVE